MNVRIEIEMSRIRLQILKCLTMSGIVWILPGHAEIAKLRQTLRRNHPGRFVNAASFVCKIPDAADFAVRVVAVHGETGLEQVLRCRQASRPGSDHAISFQTVRMDQRITEVKVRKRGTKSNEQLPRAA